MMPGTMRGLGQSRDGYPDDTYEAAILWDEDESRSDTDDSQASSGSGRDGGAGTEEASASGGRELYTPESRK
jgi:hypothetical protein